MTIAEVKLEDATTQLDLARKNIDDEKIVRSCINAFFAHARSADEVLENESQSNAELRKWSTERLKVFRAMPIARFLRQSRNHSIHKGTLPLEGITARRNLNAVTPDGHRVLDKPTTTIWIIDGAEAVGVQKYVVPLCYEYLELVCQLVADWKSERIRLGL